MTVTKNTGIEAPSGHVIRLATPADREQLVGTFVDAFFDDPVQRWVFPDPERRRRYGRHFFAMHARRLVPLGMAWMADGAASVWAPEGRWRESPLDAARLGLTAAPGVLPNPAPALRGLLSLESKHPREPHIYLAVIGVRQGRRGQGLGSALLKPGLAVADEQHLPVYLESSNELNVPLYRRHGFEVTAEHHMPGGPTMWLMWRPAR